MRDRTAVWLTTAVCTVAAAAVGVFGHYAVGHANFHGRDFPELVAFIVTGIAIPLVFVLIVTIRHDSEPTDDGEVADDV